MPTRIAEIVYKLKDKFTEGAERIRRGYRFLGDASEDAARRTSRSFDGANFSIQRLAGSVSRIRGLLAGLGSAAVATRAFQSFVDQADDVGKIAQKLGVTSEELTALGYAAERSNIPFKSMATAMQRLIRRSADAAKGMGEAKNALRDLGINAKDFAGLSLEDKMATLADALRAIDDQGERVAIAFKLFDSEGVDMVRVLQDGGAAMRTLTAEARQLGKTLDDETTEAAARFNDSLTKLSATAEGYGYRLGAGILENVNDLVEVFGLSADKAANLRSELDRLEKLQTGGNGNPFRWIFELAEFTGLSDIEADIEAVRAELEKLEQSKLAQANADSVATESAKELKTELADQASLYSDLRARAENALEERRNYLKQETDELRRAKAEQLSIEQEFQRLVEEVTTPEKKDVSALDVSLLARQAEAASARGETEEAIRLAREGGELLKRLKSEGDEAGYTLSYLAKALQRVAVESAGTAASNEAEDVRVANNTVKTMEAQLAVMTQTAESAGNAAGIAYADAMQRAMERLTLKPPKIEPIEPEILRVGKDFFDRDSRRLLESQGGK